MLVLKSLPRTQAILTSVRLYLYHMHHSSPGLGDDVGLGSTLTHTREVAPLSEQGLRYMHATQTIRIAFRC